MMKKNILKDKFIKNKLVNDSFWSLIGNVIGRGLSLSAGILVARFLGKDIYGEFGILKNTILSVAMFSTLGLGYTATKFVADLKKRDREKLNLFTNYAINITLVISGLMAVCLFIFAPKIAIQVLKAPHLQNSLRILSVIVVFNALTTTQIGLIAGIGQFKSLAKINSITGGINFILSVALTYYWDLSGALFALLITQIINWYLNYRIVQKFIQRKKISSQKDVKLLKNIISFSFPIALQEGVYAVSNWLLNYVLIIYGGYGELGLFSAANQWQAIVLFIPGILRNVILSHLSENIENESIHSTLMKQTLIINMAATIFMSIMVLLFSNIIAGFYGQTFEGLGKLLAIAVFTTVFSSMGGVYAQAYMSKGKNWEMLIIRIVRDFGWIISFVLLQEIIHIGQARLMIILGLTMNLIFLLIMAFYYKKI